MLTLFDVQRADWDPNDNTPAKNREVDVIDTFELHHTGAAGPRSLSFEDKMRWGLEIEAFHEGKKGWTDIFYQAFVFADGEIWGGRRPDRSSQSDLMTTLTVHIPGNSPQITEAQHRSLLALARWCTTDPQHLRVHSDRAKTACPGDTGRAERDRLRRELNAVPADQNLLPEDLGDHSDAIAAATKGFLHNDEPARVASRSVVGVVANRVDAAAQRREKALKDEITALKASITRLSRRVATLESTGPSTLLTEQDVVDIIVRELSN